jgi:tight adherence protein B
VVHVLTLFIGFIGATAAALLMTAARRVEAGHQARHLMGPRRWRLPARARSWLHRALEDAAIAVEPEAACELWLACVLGTTITATALAPGLGVIAALCVLAGGPVALQVARGRAQRRLVAALPGALEHVAAGLRGGATVDEAVEAIALGDGPLAPDLRRVRARAALGSGFADALAAWSAERELASVRATCGALAVASSVGGPAAGAIDGLAGSLRDRLGAAAEARALSAQARVSAIVVGVAPLAYLAFSALADPASLSVLVDTTAGRVCLAAGLGFEVLAIICMRRIVRAEDTE